MKGDDAVAQYILEALSPCPAQTGASEQTAKCECPEHHIFSDKELCIQQYPGPALWHTM
jgi:hypothetical protein